MSAIPPDHSWSHEALYAKAKVYVSKMEEYQANQWEFAFWSALCLEALARAALAYRSPVLLADSENWRNILYAMGEDPGAKRFSPSSIGVKEVLNRLGDLNPSFTQEIAGFCTQHTNRRNAELHTGDLAFVNLGTSSWLPKFYTAAKVLLALIEQDLADFVNDAEKAEEMIAASGDEAAKAVAQDVKAHAQVWANKSQDEKDEAETKVTAWATRQQGHRVECPACKSTALVQGNPIGSVTTKVEDDEVTERQSTIPTMFECIACGLRISGMSKLAAAGLGDAFIATSTYSAAEYFGLYTEDDLNEAADTGAREAIDADHYEEDFNE